MTIKKLTAIIIGLLLAVICAWLGASIYLGRSTTAAFKKVLAETPRQNAVRFVNLQHQQGLLSSNGQVEVRFNDLGASPGTGTQLVALQLEYRMANLLLPTSLTRFEWRLRPTGDAGVELNRLFGSELQLSGAGSVGYAGLARSSMAMPELVLREINSRSPRHPDRSRGIKPHWRWPGIRRAFRYAARATRSMSRT